MLAGKTLVDFTSLFSPYDFQKNDSMILSYFKDDWDWSHKLDRSNKIHIR